MDYVRRIESGLMPKKGLPWPQPSHSNCLIMGDPFMARPRVRIGAKLTLTLRDLECHDIQDAIEPEEDEQDENPFGHSDLHDFDAP